MDKYEDITDPELWSSEFPDASAETAGEWWILPPPNEYGHQIPRIAFQNWVPSCGVQHWCGDVFAANPHGWDGPYYERTGSALAARGWKIGPKVLTPRETLEARRMMQKGAG